MLLATWMQKLIPATQRYDGVQWWGEPIKPSIAILNTKKILCNGIEDVVPIAPFKHQH